MLLCKPLQQDLSHFWEQCERALNGLSSEFQVQDLKASHLRQLYMIVLGVPVWALLKNQPLDTWQELKQAAEERLGLTKDQLLDCFYRIRQGKNETAWDSIL